jgi:hypothetical protein
VLVLAKADIGKWFKKNYSVQIVEQSLFEIGLVIEKMLFLP